ncbi:hypothetical protein ICL81_06600 [Leucobacter sp. cx-328]|uniref:hypothetical protein n=1 Tax=unclassified Leucobacter TaxID=2621730 RepID=UPI0019B30379|nr:MULTISPECIES: hypothetical protein [unclassified Leucobacter]MBC9944182.1 hypothetical protein [Leucobacter sp. cx-328]
MGNFGLIDVAELDYSLVWPRELFEWEARRILTSKGNASAKIEALFGEAFADVDVAAVVAPAPRGYGAAPPSDAEDRALLQSLISNESPVRPYKRAQYWLERQKDSEPRIQRKRFSEAFLELIDEMQDLGYFPKALPRGCVDDRGSWGFDLSAEISKAIKCNIVWPDDLKQESLSFPDDVLYSVIEYFHDQAQRPRTRSLHETFGCGYHYENFSKASGGVVYRWRVNELLDSYDVGLRLGNQGDETGKLIQHAALNLDELGDQAIAVDAFDRDRTVADAIQLYRKRAATTTDRRAAIAQLANYLELRRSELKKVQFSSGDESALFQIFNKFMIRHGDSAQRGDYGDEYLDWIFWTSVSAIQLVRARTQVS